jgi:hypothetical protein
MLLGVCATRPPDKNECSCPVCHRCAAVGCWILLSSAACVSNLIPSSSYYSKWGCDRDVVYYWYGGMVPYVPTKNRECFIVVMKTVLLLYKLPLLVVASELLSSIHIHQFIVWWYGMVGYHTMPYHTGSNINKSTHISLLYLFVHTAFPAIVKILH